MPIAESVCIRGDDKFDVDILSPTTVYLLVSVCEDVLSGRNYGQSFVCSFEWSMVFRGFWGGMAASLLMMYDSHSASNVEV